jgi:phosphomevalonate kinase
MGCAVTARARSAGCHGEKQSERVERLWAGWKELDVSPLLAEESVTGGCRLEDVEAVPGLKHAIGF